MSLDFTHFQLYDTDILTLLWSGQAERELLSNEVPEDHEGVFDALQEKELIYAIFRLNYPKIYSLLRKLDHPMSPTDAMAACLCALAGTPKLLNTLLDHCPPIPNFQFQGVGQVSSLLNIAVRYDKYRMLEILLHRGADPHGCAPSLAEEAFCAMAYSCMQQLMKLPDLEIPITEELLYAWGSLTTNSDGDHFYNPCGLWCAQLLQEKLTGEPACLFDPLPVLPQLRLRHALQHANHELAASICIARNLTEDDVTDVLAHYTLDRLDVTVFATQEISNSHLITKREQENHFLCQLLLRRPDLLQAPQIRSALVIAALSLPEEDLLLTPWVQKLDDGPVLLPSLPGRYSGYFSSVQGFLQWTVEAEPHPEWFARWDARLGSRIIPTMDINDPLFPELSPANLEKLLRRVQFTGTPPTDALSPVAVQVLRHAPEDLLPDLLRPDGLLGREQPHLLLDACQELPSSRRNEILPHVRSSVDYQL